MKVGWIDYLNTVPFDFEMVGLRPAGNIELVRGYPSKINQLLYSGKIDIGFISSAEYIQHFDRYYILPDLSISALNKVHSVCVFSNRPLEDIKEIYLTKASKTSKLLTRIVFEKFFKKKPVYKPLEDYQNIQEKTVLLIGDNAIKYQKQFPYVIDLSAQWYKKTKLPFVFALWCVRRDFFERERETVLEFKEVLVKTKNIFFSDIEKFLRRLKTDIDKEFAYTYLKNLDFCLSSQHIESLELFSTYLFEMGIIGKKPIFEFIK